MTVQQRPTGITVIAIIAAILGVLGVLGGLLVVLTGVLLGTASSSADGGGLASTVVVGLVGILGIVVLATAIADIVFAYGAWTLKPWAWMVGIVIGVISIVLAALSLGGGGTTTPVVTIILWGVVIYYLNTPPVKAAFGRA